MKFMEKSKKTIKSKSKCVFLLLLLGQLCLFFVFATKRDLKHQKNKLENDPNGDFLYSVYIHTSTSL